MFIFIYRDQILKFFSISKRKVGLAIGKHRNKRPYQVLKSVNNTPVSLSASKGTRDSRYLYEDSYAIILSRLKLKKEKDLSIRVEVGL